MARPKKGCKLRDPCVTVFASGAGEVRVPSRVDEAKLIDEDAADAEFAPMVTPGRKRFGDTGLAWARIEPPNADDPKVASCGRRWPTNGWPPRVPAGLL